MVDRPPQDARLKLQNDARTALLQGLGALLVLTGAAIGARVTLRQVQATRDQIAETAKASQNQLKLSDRELETTREGQITERYTRAIDQLGNDQLDVRLGGIYALERIARDSSADRTTIGEVLTAFVRRHAPWPPRLPGQYVVAAPIDQVSELQVRAPDVQASLTVLGRGFARPEGKDDRLELHASDLRQARLRQAYLVRADLRDTHLERAKLTDAHLEGADLRDAHLEEAVLRNAYLGRVNLERAHLERAWLNPANLEGADLQDAHLELAILAGANLARTMLASAHLEGAYLYTANLQGAVLVGANLEYADLVGANLEGANLGTGGWEWTNTAGGRVFGGSPPGSNLKRAKLWSANLKGADLAGAHLEEALADEHTVWPDEFDWRAAGVILEGEDTTASP